jgi:hypothetical protein
MRYAVELADLSEARDLVLGASSRGRLGASRRLDPVARALAGGATTFALPRVIERWRAREREVWEGVAAHAGHLAEAIEGYSAVEASAAEALGKHP